MSENTNAAGLPALPSLPTLRGHDGDVFYVQLVGSTSGAVWGTPGSYTDDSSLAAAAVHAGALRDGERGIVKITLKPGQASYSGTERNGVTTLSYGPWPGSFDIERAPEGFKPPTLYQWNAENGSRLWRPEPNDELEQLNFKPELR